MAGNDDPVPVPVPVLQLLADAGGVGIWHHDVACSRLDQLPAQQNALRCIVCTEYQGGRHHVWRLDGVILCHGQSTGRYASYNPRREPLRGPEIHHAASSSPLRPLPSGVAQGFSMCDVTSAVRRTRSITKPTSRCSISWSGLVSDGTRRISPVMCPSACIESPASIRVTSSAARPKLARFTVTTCWMLRPSSGRSWPICNRV